MEGDLTYPAELDSLPSKVLVNPLLASRYLENYSEGLLGDGRWIDDGLLFRLYISPTMARDILIRQLIAPLIEGDVTEGDPLANIKLLFARIRERIPQDLNVSEDDWVWMKLRIHAINFFTPTGPFAEEGQVSFDIIGVDC